MKIFAVLLLLGILVGAFADPVHPDEDAAEGVDLLAEEGDSPDEDEAVGEDPISEEDTETEDEEGDTEEDPKSFESDVVEDSELADEQEDPRKRLILCSVRRSHVCYYYRRWFRPITKCSCSRCPRHYSRECGKKVQKCRRRRSCFYTSRCSCKEIKRRRRECSVHRSHSCTYYKWFFWNKGCSCYRCPAGYYRKCGKKVRRCDGRFCYYRSPCSCKLVPRKRNCHRFLFHACSYLKDCVNGKCSTLRKCYCDCRKGTVHTCFRHGLCACRRPRRRWG
ncbi:uncharacterized protein LOC135689490 [Rhopilema esculentum]|uniref:uncharacterized protein LOC135689490 n=1 Tax=Rhopilema esculentum TaxID=499914 RepID=UPI0031DDB725